MKKLLIVVDYQNDFVSGSLGFPRAAELEEAICEKINAYRKEEQAVVATLDTHGEDYDDTQEGRNLPVPHCLQGSQGWRLYGKAGELLQDCPLFQKDTFGSKALFHYLEENPFDVIELVGVVSNICVLSNAVIAKTAQPEAEIVVDARCTASNNGAMNEKALDVLQGIQVKVIGRE